MAARASFHLETFEDAAEQERGLPGWGQRYTQLDRGAFQGSITRLDLGRVKIFDERINVGCDMTSSPPEGTVLFALPGKPEGRGWINGVELSQHITMHKGGNEISVVQEPNCYGLFVLVDIKDVPRVDNAQVAPVATVAGGAEIGQMAAWLRALIAHAPETLRETPGALSDAVAPLLLDRVRELAELFIAAPRQPTLGESAAFQLFRRVREIVDNGQREALTVAGLAEELGVPEHVLRQAFLQTVGVTPSHWIRQRRLDHVRRALMAPGRAAKGVSQIAMENGFYHLGRFAGYYASVFGETPYETLRAALG